MTNPFKSSPTQYTQALRTKTRHLQTLLTPYYQGEIAVYPSQPEHYRLRAEFRIWHDDNNLHYVMIPPGEKASSETIIKTPQFPQASLAINRLMPILLKAITDSPQLKDRLFQIEFLNTLAGDMLVTLIYHRQLDDAWQTAAELLAQRLNIKLIGRARKQKIVLSTAYVQEKLMVNQQTFSYRQYEGGFTQPNGNICQEMLNWAIARCTEIHSPHNDLLELYCGNGNFTLPLAQQFRQVLATEISKTSIHALKENLILNNIDNVQIARLSAEEFYAAWQGQRTFRRLRQNNIELSDYRFSTIFVDPPRAGIDHNTLTLMQQIPTILYISCNPQTLADNLAQLCQTHRITHAALFDQFPQTPHIEAGVFLSKP